jgi:hypothetical protein
MGVLQCDGVGGAAMVILMHLKVPAMLLPRLCRTDLGERHVMMRYNEEDMHAPFLEVSLPSFFQIWSGSTAVLPSTRLHRWWSLKFQGHIYCASE